jgi:YVTN family beta-propeller protein
MCVPIRTNQWYRRPMEFRVLGPLEIADDGRLLSLGSGRQLALIALLLLHRNQVVSTERIVDELWEGSPPPTAAKIVRNTVSLLRRELGDRLLTRPPGYLLRVEPGELDAERLERALIDGDLESLTAALALWRGTPLAQAYHDFARNEVERLQELNQTAIEARLDAELEQGEHARLVPELEALVRAHPLRERLREQLMLALYRSGRQADALEAYQDARRTLDAELGLEPSRGLQELERKILTQDESLATPARSPAVLDRRRAGLLIALGAAAVVAGGIAAAAITIGSGGATTALPRIAPNSVGVLDPDSNRFVAQIPVGATPAGLALTGDSLWVVNSGDRTVSRIEPDRRVVVRTIAVPGDPSGIGADDSGAWVVYARTQGQYSQSAGAAFIDARYNDVKLTVSLNRLFDSSGSFALLHGAAWTAGAGFATRLDPSGKIVKSIRVSPIGAAGFEAESGIAFGEGALWAIGSADIVRIDPSTGEIAARIPIAQNATGGAPNPTAIAVGEGAVWVASRRVEFSSLVGAPNGAPVLRGIVSRIDPKTNAVVATIPVGADPFGISAGEGSVWVANRRGFTISRIDPDTNRVIASIPVGNRPQGVVAGGGTIWVSVS